MMPGGERFRPSWRGLQPGDPWTFITATPIRQGISGTVSRIGTTIEWLPDDGTPLLFRVDDIAVVDQRIGRLAYTCTHISQPPAFCEAEA